MDWLILGRWSGQDRLREALLIFICDDPVGEHRAGRISGCRTWYRNLWDGRSSRDLARCRRTRDGLVEVGCQHSEIGAVDDAVVIEIALGEIAVLSIGAGEGVEVERVHDAIAICIAT